MPRRPPPPARASTTSRSCCSARSADRRFLLTGDAEEGVDPVLIARGLPRVDVLKVAHHGSATATTAALLDAMRPTVGLISVGGGNDYGHPAPSTLARLRTAGVRVYRTDKDGAIEADLTPTASRSGRRTGAHAPRPWPPVRFPA